jgi:hypothetical protein
MEAFKHEVAEELGLAEKLDEIGWSGMSTIEVGTIGGEMVRRVMIAGEIAILDRYMNGERPLLPRLADAKQLRSQSPHKVPELVPDMYNEPTPPVH